MTQQYVPQTYREERAVSINEKTCMHTIETRVRKIHEVKLKMQIWENDRPRTIEWTAIPGEKMPDGTWLGPMIFADEPGPWIEETIHVPTVDMDELIYNSYHR